MTRLIPAVHELIEYEVSCAYQAGLRDGRAAFAQELLPAVRWLLAGVGYVGQEDERDTLIRVLGADFDELMARHLRAIERRQARATWDRANRLDTMRRTE